jgi:hypothetical protein
LSWVQDVLSKQDHRFIEQSLKIDHLEKENAFLKEKMSSLEKEKVLSLEKDMTRASVAFQSIVQGTESDFHVMRVELDQLRQEVGWCFHP